LPNVKRNVKKSVDGQRAICDYGGVMNGNQQTKREGGNMTITIQTRTLSDGSKVNDLILCGGGPSDGLITLSAVGDRTDAVSAACNLARIVEHATTETAEIIEA
jgi:hypothetical protein